MKRKDSLNSHKKHPHRDNQLTLFHIQKKIQDCFLSVQIIIIIIIIMKLRSTRTQNNS